MVGWAIACEPQDKQICMFEALFGFKFLLELVSILRKCFSILLESSIHHVVLHTQRWDSSGHVIIIADNQRVVAWKILKDHLEPVTKSKSNSTIRDQFFGTKYQPGEDVGIFISRVKTAATRLQEAGHKLDDLYIGFFQFHKVASSLIQSTNNKSTDGKEEDFRVVKIEAELILEANRLQLMKQDFWRKRENVYLSSFTSKKSKTLPGATAAAHGYPNGKNDYQKERCSQSEVPRDHYNGAQRINPENRIPAQLACAYLKGHLKGRALDWFEVLGYRVIEDKTTDYAHLKQALSEQFPVVRNRSELETRFYSSSQRRDQQPSDFIYELLKIHKILKLEMSEEKLIDHVISRLEPQILDYVEVRHPRNTANLLQIVDKYEERFMHRQIRGSSEGFRSSGPHENNRFNTRHRQEN
ncbi:uncharacterized protein TNCV_1260401 [Trichonephila clavipes]|nr:uncharacterized protein TNCV_1260401 [Trichonephila clavipes]